MTKNSFLKGAFILGMAGVVANILGAIFRIPLGRIIGSEGLGYYQAVFPIYIMLLNVSAAGFPTAISQLVSQKIALNDYKGAHNIFKTSFSVLFSVGFISFLILFIGADYIVNNIIKSPKAYYSMRATAPALLLVPIMSTFRGYFQGRQDMTPTAVSQIMEQLGRVVIGICLALILLPKGTKLAAAGASFGATTGAILGTLYILSVYIKKKSTIKEEISSSKVHEQETKSEIVKKLLSIAIPITIGSTILPIMNLIDLGIVIGRLQSVGYSYDKANILYGQLNGMAASLINFPYAITTALSMSMVPSVSYFYTVKDNEGLTNNIKTGVRVALLIGLPASFGLAVLSTPFMQMLYPNEPSSVGQMLLYLSMCVVLLGLIQAFTAVLQGIEKTHIPVINLSIGAIFKIALTYILIAVPDLNVKGAPVASLISYIVILILNYRYIKKHVKVEFDTVYFIVKPLMSATIMATLVSISYNGVLIIAGNTLACLVSVVVGGIGYGLALIKTNSISKEEILMMPKGEKLYKIVRKIS
ncbi:putative polysaccharide biosynthesis protein [Tepidibacter sp. Z1-5]|uniref:putative polysaccharide biosynthesis protein n=1 Tax=Tepidibacter sp. Z1-5 TaxID=3134138 RepID=UPI0030C3D91A